jgi:hypothetical protein
MTRYGNLGGRRRAMAGQTSSIPDLNLTLGVVCVEVR